MATLFKARLIQIQANREMKNIVPLVGMNGDIRIWMTGDDEASFNRFWSSLSDLMVSRLSEETDKGFAARSVIKPESKSF